MVQERSYEVNNPTAKLLPAVCFAPGLFLRDGSKVLFSIILEYGLPRHFSLPCLEVLFLKCGSKNQGGNLVFGAFLFVPTPFGFQHIDCRNYPLREEKQGLCGFSEVPVMYVEKIFCVNIFFYGIRL